VTTKLASELAGKYITVNALAPGFFPSKMSKGLLHYTDGSSVR
jgi:NAD(P)-dependent dehydrogenase (short-subunit alcohol dehydrogenase family)